MTQAQHAALDAIDKAGGDMSWFQLKKITHPWTRGSLIDRGWVEVSNDPHRDEVWSLTESGRAALPSGKLQEPRGVE